MLESLRRGMYFVFLREWLKVIPRRQFLILETEETRKDPKSTLLKLMDFLDTGECLIYVCLSGCVSVRQSLSERG